MFKDKLKFLRKYQELSQEQVAKTIDVLQSTYSRYEQGRFDEELNTRKRIVDIYYETFGEKEIWSIRTTMFEMQLLQELEDVLKNLKRRNEKLEVRKKIKKLEKKIEDYINKSPEQASQEIKALINENKY